MILMSKHPDPHDPETGDENDYSEDDGFGECSGLKRELRFTLTSLLVVVIVDTIVVCQSGILE